MRGSMMRITANLIALWAHLDLIIGSHLAPGQHHVQGHLALTHVNEAVA